MGENNPPSLFLQPYSASRSNSSPNGKASPKPSEGRGEPNGSQLEKGTLNTKRAFL